MIAIGLIGPKAAGKDTVASYIQNKEQALVYRFAGILDEILIILTLPITRENEVKLVHLREVFGENVLLEALRKRISQEQPELAIILGVRFQNELDFVKSFENNKLIYVDADMPTRYQHQIQRKQRADDQQSYEDFVKAEQARTETEIGALKAQADFIVENNGTPEQLHEKIERILQAII